MSALVAVAASIGGLVVLLVRSLAVDEVRGRVRRRTERDLESTIEALPGHLRAEWATEWRAELASVISMPLTAWRFVRGVRRSATDLLAEEPAASVDLRRAMTLRVAQSLARTFAALRPARRLAFSAFAYAVAAGIDFGLFQEVIEIWEEVEVASIWWWIGAISITPGAVIFTVALLAIARSFAGDVLGRSRSRRLS